MFASHPKPPQLLPTLTHAAVVAVSRYWWLLLVVAVLFVVRGIVWFVQDRRLARSGINEIDRMDGLTFERRLSYLFSNMGYRVEQTRARGDYGVDLILEKDGIRTVVQAKRWTKNVGVKAVQEAVAAMPMYRCDAAMVVTNRNFTDPARRLARANHVQLWNRDALIEALIENSDGGAPTAALRLTN